MKIWVELSLSFLSPGGFHFSPSSSSLLLSSLFFPSWVDSQHSLPFLSIDWSHRQPFATTVLIGSLLLPFTPLHSNITQYLASQTPLPPSRRLCNDAKLVSTVHAPRHLTPQRCQPVLSSVQSISLHHPSTFFRLIPIQTSLDLWTHNLHAPAPSPKHRLLMSLT